MGFVLEDERSANSSFVEMIWRIHSEHAGTFTSVAASNWEMVIATFNGKTMIPRKRNQKRGRPHNAALYRERNRVRHFFYRPVTDSLKNKTNSNLPWYPRY